MNLQLIFRINGAILFINGLFFLFLTEMFLGMAGFDMTAVISKPAIPRNISVKKRKNKPFIKRIAPLILKINCKFI